jgi:ferredoxin
MELRIDTTRCEGHAQCIIVAPELFDLGDDDVSVVLNPRPTNEQQDLARRAAQMCPIQAISVGE